MPRMAPPDAMTRDIWTIRDVAQYLQMSERNVLTRAQKGQIPGRQIGVLWRFSRKQIVAMFDDAK